MFNQLCQSPGFDCPSLLSFPFQMRNKFIAKWQFVCCVITNFLQNNMVYCIVFFLLAPVSDLVAKMHGLATYACEGLMFIVVHCRNTIWVQFSPFE
jgi:hypothetical protein